MKGTHCTSQTKVYARQSQLNVIKRNVINVLDKAKATVACTNFINAAPETDLQNKLNHFECKASVYNEWYDP